MKFNDLFPENETEIDSLIKFKWPLSKKEEKILLSGIDRTYVEYRVLIRLWRGKIVERVFAVRKKKRKNTYRAEYMEVIRKVEGNSLIACKNIYFVQMGGYHCFWKDSKSNYNFNSAYYNVWFSAERKYYHIFATPLFTLDDLIKFDPYLKYCAYNVENGKIPVTDWITVYRKYPEIEMLAKIKKDHLFCKISVLEKMRNQRFKKYLMKNKNDFIGAKEVVYGFNRNLTLLQVKQEKEITSFIHHVIKEYDNIDRNKLRKYLEKHYDCEKAEIDIPLQSYLDMLKAETYFHLDLTSDKNAFPKDFEYWHKFYTNRMNASENEKIDEGIRKNAGKFKKLVNVKGLESIHLSFPENTQDLINEGEKLSHCVGRMNYNEKMSKGESLIIFIRKEKDVSLYTMEFDPKSKKIRQFYGFKNSLPDQETKDLIYNVWLPKVQKMRFTV